MMPLPSQIYLLLISQPTTPANVAVLPSGGDLALGNARLERTAAEVSLLSIECRGGRDVKIKDIHRQAERGASVGHVDDARHVALDGRARKQKVDLVV